MAQEGFRRKLTAILSADVVGYSRLMEDNEEATIQTLNTYRNSMSTLIQQHRGRVVDATGDNLMAEFSSVVDAVRCAVETQKEMSQRNAELPENRRMLLRIGVNLGDIVEEEDLIYGDGVNIAARLEGLAQAGGICISRTAYDQVKNKLELGYEFLGEHSVKNISEPVHVYKVLMEPEAVGKIIGEKRKEKRWITLSAVIVLLIGVGGLAGWYLYLEQSKQVEPASIEQMAYPLPDKPSIAVLPFDNLSGDPEQEHISDGITEEIITALSKTRKLFVIARHSTFTYKGKPVKVQQVSDELGVRYVLEGSFRKAGERVRVTAQLIDATTSHHLWAERYDRDLKDVFALQDEITMKIINALEVKLTEGEQASIPRKGTASLEAYVKALQAIEYLNRRNKDDNLLARQMAEEAIALDPGYSRPYRVLGYTYLRDIRYGMSRSPKKSVQKALELVQKAISLDDSHPCNYELLSVIYLYKRQPERALAEAKHCIAIDPNGADGHAQLGYALYAAGRPEEAIASLKKAIRLNPIPPAYYLDHIGEFYRFTERYEEAIAAFQKALSRSPNDQIAHMGLTATYFLSGRDEEARSQAKEVLRLQPKFSFEGYAKRLRLKNQADRKHLIDALRKAGLK
jgi:adenylate cyclase